MAAATFVCIVDDDPIYVFGTRRLLERTGRIETIRSFSNGEEALQYLKNEANPVPQLLFLDINMPLVDGWQFLNGFDPLRAAEPDRLGEIQIFMVSSSIHDADISRAIQHPLVSGYLIKPVTTTQLDQVFAQLK